MKNKVVWDILIIIGFVVFMYVIIYACGSPQHMEEKVVEQQKIKQILKPVIAYEIISQYDYDKKDIDICGPDRTFAICSQHYGVFVHSDGCVSGGAEQMSPEEHAMICGEL